MADGMNSYAQELDLFGEVILPFGDPFDRSEIDLDGSLGPYHSTEYTSLYDGLEPDRTAADDEANNESAMNADNNAFITDNKTIDTKERENDIGWHGIEENTSSNITTMAITPPLPEVPIDSEPVSRLSARPIADELDSDDQIICSMKRDGRTDKEVAQSLRDDKRVNYNEKTIGTRWNRLQYRLAEKRDIELDAGVYAWPLKHDAFLLHAAYNFDVSKFRAGQSLNVSRWDFVSKEMRKCDADAHYSARACRQRWESFLGLTAICHPDLDADPERRYDIQHEKKKALEVRMANEAHAKMERALKRKESVMERQRLSAARSKQTRVAKFGSLAAARAHAKQEKEKAARAAGLSTPDTNQKNPISETRSRSTTPQTASVSHTECPGESITPAKPQSKEAGMATAAAIKAAEVLRISLDPLLSQGLTIKKLSRMSRDECKKELVLRGFARTSANRSKKEIVEMLRKARNNEITPDPGSDGLFPGGLNAAGESVDNQHAKDLVNQEPAMGYSTPMTVNQNPGIQNYYAPSAAFTESSGLDLSRDTDGYPAKRRKYSAWNDAGFCDGLAPSTEMALDETFEAMLSAEESAGGPAEAVGFTARKRKNHEANGMEFANSLFDMGAATDNGTFEAHMGQVLRNSLENAGPGAHSYLVPPESVSGFTYQDLYSSNASQDYTDPVLAGVSFESSAPYTADDLPGAFSVAPGDDDYFTNRAADGGLFTAFPAGGHSTNTGSSINHVTGASAHGNGLYDPFDA